VREETRGRTRDPIQPRPLPPLRLRRARFACFAPARRGEVGLGPRSPPSIRFSVLRSARVRIPAAVLSWRCCFAGLAAKEGIGMGARVSKATSCCCIRGQLPGSTRLDSADAGTYSLPLPTSNASRSLGCACPGCYLAPGVFPACYFWWLHIPFRQTFSAADSPHIRP
jgi:hypothetical protein